MGSRFACLVSWKSGHPLAGLKSRLKATVSCSVQLRSCFLDRPPSFIECPSDNS